jgi:hypothetical protein
MPVDHGRPSPFKACHIVNGGTASSFCSANLCWTGNARIVFGQAYRHLSLHLTAQARSLLTAVRRQDEQLRAAVHLDDRRL